MLKLLLLLFFFKENPFKICIYSILGCAGSSLLRVSVIVASAGYSSLWCTGFSLWWLLLLWSLGSQCPGFSNCTIWAQFLARGFSCPEVCGIFPDQRSNPCLLPRQADSYPLRHQGIPGHCFLNLNFIYF